MTLPCPARREAGTTLIEVLVAATLVAAAFAAIFEVNAVCLRYIDASKECVAAVQGVQDRVEGLRNLDFSKLTNPTYMVSQQPTPTPTPYAPAPVSLYLPSNSSDLAARVWEVVTISAYPSGSPSITYWRPPGAAVTPSASPGTSVDFSTTSLVKVTVQYYWNAAFAGRATVSPSPSPMPVGMPSPDRTELTETLIAAGTKK
jgi:Tfp pilus assembly protein PilV